MSNKIRRVVIVSVFLLLSKTTSVVGMDINNDLSDTDSTEYTKKSFKNNKEIPIISLELTDEISKDLKKAQPKSMLECLDEHIQNVHNEALNINQKSNSVCQGLTSVSEGLKNICLLTLSYPCVMGGWGLWSYMCDPHCIVLSSRIQE